MSFLSPMKLVRFLLGAVAVVAVLLLLGVVLLFNSSFQTWAARKALEGRPGPQIALGSVSAGLQHVVVKDLRVEQDGRVLVLPSLEADVALVTAALHQKIVVSRLLALGWTLDLSRAAAGSADATKPAPAGPGAASAATPGGDAASRNRDAATVAVQAFAGVFGGLQLPVDLALDGLRLEGDVIMPEGQGRLKVAMAGGGLKAGQEGKFELNCQAVLENPEVTAVKAIGQLNAVMDSPRTFGRLAAKIDAFASGGQFPKGAKLMAEISAARLPDGEKYSAAVVSQDRPALSVDADFPRSGGRLSGGWKLDLRDADLAPFALGRPLPAFAMAGEGRFDTDATFASIHATGRLDLKADRLQIFRAELAALGELKMAAEFDLARHAGILAVRKLEATVSAAQPIATVRALQGFDFNPHTGDLQATDPNRDLAGIVIHGVPVAWAKPFLTSVDLAGGSLRGELVASARGGGMTLRSTSPIVLDLASVGQASGPLLQQVTLSFNAAGDYTPRGWQAEISGLSAKSDAATLVTLDAKVGRLLGKDEPLKATGKISASLPAILAQPAARNRLRLASGDGAVDFVASLDGRKKFQARLALTNLSVGADSGTPGVTALPALSADLRANMGENGETAFEVPLVIERGGRKSDLLLAGSVKPARNNVRLIDAHATSTQLVIDDAKVFAALLPVETAPTGVAKPDRTGAPPWAGFQGAIALQLKKVIYSETFQVGDVGGRLRVGEEGIKLEGFRAGLGEQGRVDLDGKLTYDRSNPQPYALSADLTVQEFDPGPLFKTFGGGQPATVEGKFDIASKLAARAGALDELAVGAAGEFQLTSKGGVFRGLPVNVSNLTEQSGRIAGWIASAGSALGAMTGRKDYADIANKAQAVGEVAKGLSAIPYDQMSMVVTRDKELNAVLKDFTLISPEIRLTGTGQTVHKPGSSLLEDALTMEFKLRARGRQGELLKYLGALEPQVDDLGYAAFALPLKIGGTLGRPDTSELSGKLTALALEKSGVTEKASEFLNRLLGGGK